jgi:hypothetical protein
MCEPGRVEAQKSGGRQPSLTLSTNLLNRYIAATRTKSACYPWFPMLPKLDLMAKLSV